MIDAARRWGHSVCRHPVELWSAFTLVLWSKIMFWGGHTLDHNANYRVALALWDDSTWEIVAFAVGCAQFGSIACPSRWGRMAGAGLAAWYFTLFAVAFWAAHAGSPGFAVYVGWAAANIHAVIRTARRG